MTRLIPHSDPLERYHRGTPNFAGRSEDEVARQWGRAEVTSDVPASGFLAGSYQTVVIRFTVGSLGLDEDGGLKLSFRFVSDMGRLQSGDPEAENYVTVRASGNAAIEVQAEPKGSTRPFQRTVFLHCRNASLAEGDTVDILLGDSSGGSPGWRQQTYFEAPFPIRVSVDPLGTHDYQQLPRDLGWNIVSGPVARYVVNVPSFAAKDDVFDLRVKAEDEWGNPLRDLSRDEPRILLLRNGEERLLAAKGSHEAGVWRYPLSLAEEGSYFFRIEGNEATISNGVTIRSSSELPRYRHNWCDLHGQTGETVGAGTIRDYFHFGRHYGFLDGSVHQGNDFQIGLDTWKHIKDVSNDAYEPGEFVTFQGYEWSGTEAMGGDHNVIYHEDDPPIYRSSGWLDGNPFEETAPLPELYRTLRLHKALTIAHVGGRPAALTASDPKVEPAMEIHSAWGTFEWVYHEAFARGFKIGFVCNSDGHKCRPGASYPGAGIFGTLGGLTCLLSENRDRDGFWDALRSRRCYGTTGQRIVVEADMNGHPIGSAVEAEKAIVRARVLGTSPIVRLDLMKRTEIIQSYVQRGEMIPDTVVVRFGGARVKGRARRVAWKGRATIDGNRFAESTMNGIYSPSYGMKSRSDSEVAFECMTTGNLVNLEFRFEAGLDGDLKFESNQTAFSLDLASLDSEPRLMFEAPLDQRVEVFVCNRQDLPTEIATSFVLDIDHANEVPYFLRVTQLDEGKAWTSPFYVRALQ